MARALFSSRKHIYQPIVLVDHHIGSLEGNILCFFVQTVFRGACSFDA